MSMMVSFVLSFFPRDVLDEILNLIESVSEDFPSYSFLFKISRSQDYKHVSFTHVPFVVSIKRQCQSYYELSTLFVKVTRPNTKKK